MDTLNGLVNEGTGVALGALTLVFVLAAFVWIRHAMKADKKLWTGLIGGFVIYIFVAGVISGAWMNLADRIAGDAASAAPAITQQ